MTTKVNYTRTDDAVIAVCGKTTLTINFAEVSEKVIKPLVLRGISDKTRDRHAKSATMTEAEVIESIKESFQNFKDGIFNAGGTGGGNLLAEAISRVQKVDIVKAKAIVDKLDEVQLKSVNAHPKVKLAIAEIRTERAKANAEVAVEVDDLDELLEGV